MVEDNVLLSSYAKTQDAEAFAELVRRYAGMVYGTCLRVVRNPHDAEDAAQECFMELARKAGGITSSVAGWLHTTARHRSIDMIRRATTRGRYEEEAMSEAQGNEKVTWEEISPVIDKAIEEIPEDLRVAMVLHYFSGKTQEEVAEELGVNQSTVSRRLEKGVWELRGLLRKAGIIASATLLAALMTENGFCAAPATLIGTLGKMAVAGIGAGATAAATAGGTAVVSSAAATSAAGASSVGGAALLGTLKAKVVALLISGAVIAGGVVAVKEAVKHDTEKPAKASQSTTGAEKKKPEVAQLKYGFRYDPMEVPGDAGGTRFKGNSEAELFGREELAKWKATPGFEDQKEWQFKDGVYSGSNGWVAHPASFGDFVLDVDIMFSGEGQGGLVFRGDGSSQEPWGSGYELDIDWYRDRTNGHIHFAVKPEAYDESAIIEVGKWHAIRVRAQGEDVTVFLDGEPALKFTDDEFSSGNICLEGDREGVKYRNLRITPISDTEVGGTFREAAVRAAIGQRGKGDSDFFAKECIKILKTQREDGGFGDTAKEAGIVLSRLLDLNSYCGGGGISNYGRVKEAADAILRQVRDGKSGGEEPFELDGRLPPQALRALCLAGRIDNSAVAGITDAPEVKETLLWLVDHPEQWVGEGCPWTPALVIKALWDGRDIVDTKDAIDKGLTWIYESLNGAGCISYFDPWSFIDCAGYVDHPLCRHIVEKQLPLILRSQQDDGGWQMAEGWPSSEGDFVVFRALAKYGLLEKLRKLPPLPPDWKVVRSIPLHPMDIWHLPTDGGTMPVSTMMDSLAPLDDLWQLEWDGEQFWTYDRKTNQAIAFSPKDGSQTKRIKLPDGNLRGMCCWKGSIAITQEGLWGRNDPTRLVIIDAKTGETKKQIPLDDLEHVGGVAAVDGTLWLVDSFFGKVEVLDPEKPVIFLGVKYSERKEVRLPGPLATDLATEGDAIWQDDLWAHGLIKSDVEGKFLDWAERPLGDSFGGLAWDGKQLWALDTKQKRICAVERRKETEMDWVGIDGMKSFENVDSTLSHMRAIRCVLEHYGETVSWPWLMGISGEAFCYYYHPDGTFLSQQVHSWDVANAALNAYGYEGKWRSDVGNDVMPALKAIRWELSAGRPVIAPGIMRAPNGVHSRCDHWFVVSGISTGSMEVRILGAGSDEAEQKVPWGDSDDPEAHPRWYGILRTFDGIEGHYGPPRADNPILLIAKKSGEVDKKEIVREALRHAVDLAHEESTASTYGWGAGTYLSGLNALQRLHDDLSGAKGKGIEEFRELNPPTGDPFGGIRDELPFLLLLSDRRQSASLFLGETALYVPGRAHQHLVAAGASYMASSMEALHAFESCCGTRKEFGRMAQIMWDREDGDDNEEWVTYWTRVDEAIADPEKRKTLAERVARIIEHEKAAVAELEKVLAIMEEDAMRGEVVIEGVPNLAGWGKGEECTFMGSLALTLRFLGEDVDYDYLMGVSGQAFRLQMCQPDWCGSAPDAGCGFNTTETAKEAVGYSWDEVRADPEKSPPENSDAILDSIEAGKPVVAIDLNGGMDWGVISGYSDGGKTLLCRLYEEQGQEYVHQRKWPCVAVVIGKKTGEPDRKANYVQSLRYAVEMAHAEKYDNYASGFAAYEVWIRDLSDEKLYERDGDKVLAMIHPNAWCYYSLYDARSSAARYLRRIEGEFSQDVGSHLSAAADIYEQIAKDLGEGQKHAPFVKQLGGKPWTKEMRLAEVEVLKKALEQEKKAVAELEKALAIMEESLVERSDSMLMIEGVPTLGWGKRKDTTFCGALEAALAVTEHRFTYEQLMGYSGLAFRVRWFQGSGEQKWCPSSAVGEFPEEYAAIQTATGWKLACHSMLEEENPHMEQFARAIVKSIDARMPVLVYEPQLNMDVIYGYEDRGRTVLLRDYFKGEEPLRLPVSKLGAQITFIGEHEEGLSKREAIAQGLRIALKNWDREPLKGAKGDYLYGKAALQQWMEDIGASAELDEKDRDNLFFVSWWCVEILEDARVAACVFLRDSAKVLGGEAGEALIRAADLYEEEGKLLRETYEKKDAFLGPWSGKKVGDWTDDVRKREREILSKIMVIEGKAIAEIRKAVDVLDGAAE